MIKQKLQLGIDFFEAIEKKATDAGNSARVYLPHSWTGKKVIVLRVEE